MDMDSDKELQLHRSSYNGARQGAYEALMTIATSVAFGAGVYYAATFALALYKTRKAQT